MTAPDPPASLLPLLDGLDWRRDQIGESGCTVWELGPSGEPRFFLKQAAGEFIPDLVNEYARLEWFAGRLPVPEIRGFVRTEANAWLLTTALPGRPAEEVLAHEPSRRNGLTQHIALFLRRLHSLPVEECPFNATLPLRLAAARRNIESGRVDENDFDAERKGWTADQVWNALQSRLPLFLDDAVTHGDFSLGNLLVLEGRVTGCIDVGRAGVADPYQDLAILWNCLREVDPALTAMLWRTYGIEQPDERRIELHLLLDELF